MTLGNAYLLFAFAYLAGSLALSAWSVLSWRRKQIASHLIPFTVICGLVNVGFLIAALVTGQTITAVVAGVTTAGFAACIYLGVKMDEILDRLDKRNDG